MKIEIHNLDEVSQDCWEAQITIDKDNYYVIADVSTDIVVKKMMGPTNLVDINDFPWITSDPVITMMAAVVAAHIEDIN